MKAELDRSRSRNHADKENKRVRERIASVSHFHFSANNRENDSFPAASLSS